VLSKRALVKGRILAMAAMALGPVVATVMLISPSAASAAIGNPTCPHGANLTSSACYYGNVMNGIFTEFRNYALTFTNQAYERAGGHINETIWGYSDAPCSYWQETGLTQGYHGNVVYEWYWAYDTPGGGYDDFPAGAANADNSLHSYEILYDGGGNYTAYRDFGVVGNVGGLGAGMCIGQTGIEVSNGDIPYTQSGNFEDNPLQWENTSGSWFYGWSTSDYWIDDPCGSQGYTSPNCLNGTFYNNNNQYYNNKP
jgi:hypothetical protein